jgi:hypothetical protein
VPKVQLHCALHFFTGGLCIDVHDVAHINWKFLLMHVEGSRGKRSTSSTVLTGKVSTGGVGAL